MSLMNVWVGPDRLLVAVDTLAVRLAAGNAAELAGTAGKVIALPHARSLLAHRGSVTFMAALSFSSHLAMDLASFDDIDRQLPRDLEKAMAVVEATAKAQGGGMSFDGQDVFVGGWSDSRAAMCGALYQHRSREAGFVRVEIGGAGAASWMAPWAGESLGPVPDISTPEGMVRGALLQHEHVWSVADSGFESVPIGGRLLLADLSREAVSIQTAAVFDV